MGGFHISDYRNGSFGLLRKTEKSSKQKSEYRRCGNAGDRAIFTECNYIESVIWMTNNWNYRLFSVK